MNVVHSDPRSSLIKAVFCSVSLAMAVAASARPALSSLRSFFFLPFLSFGARASAAAAGSAISTAGAADAAAPEGEICEDPEPGRRLAPCAFSEAFSLAAESLRLVLPVDHIAERYKIWSGQVLLDMSLITIKILAILIVY